MWTTVPRRSCSWAAAGVYREDSRCIPPLASRYLGEGKSNEKFGIQSFASHMAFHAGEHASPSQDHGRPYRTQQQYGENGKERMGWDKRNASSAVCHSEHSARPASAPALRCDSFLPLPLPSPFPCYYVPRPNLRQISRALSSCPKQSRMSMTIDLWVSSRCAEESAYLHQLGDVRRSTERDQAVVGPASTQ